MKKTGLLLLVTLLLALALSGCGNTCKEEGCDDEVYQDGYCKYHYTMHNVDETAKGVFNGIFGK